MQQDGDASHATERLLDASFALTAAVHPLVFVALNAGASLLLTLYVEVAGGLGGT
jgi:hypothetical protein